MDTSDQPIIHLHVPEGTTVILKDGNDKRQIKGAARVKLAPTFRFIQIRFRASGGEILLTTEHNGHDRWICYAKSSGTELKQLRVRKPRGEPAEESDNENGKARKKSIFKVKKTLTGLRLIYLEWRIAIRNRLPNES